MADRRRRWSPDQSTPQDGEPDASRRDWERLFAQDRVRPPGSHPPASHPTASRPPAARPPATRPPWSTPGHAFRPNGGDRSEALGLALPPMGWRHYLALTGIVAVTLLSYVVQLTRTEWTEDLALYGPLVRSGEWWRLLTVSLVHSSWAHVGSNLAALAIWGRSVEHRFGPFGLVGVYALTGVCSGAASTIVHPHGASVGASGAVFGVMGAIIAVLWRERRRPGMATQLQGAAGFAGISLVVAAVFPNVDTVAHVAGLASGLAVGGLFDLVRLRYRRNRPTSD